MFDLNLIQKIKNRIFPFYKNSELKFVFKKLQEGFSNQSKIAMFVGGCVRKHLSNKEIDDIDIATSLTTDQIKEKFDNTKFRVINSGIKHGTVTLVSDKLKLEVTTLRKDLKTDGRHAEIEYTDDWKEDSKRRDFTINAIYLDIKGKIFDPQLGVKDLKNLTVKFIGDPYKRIEEDYLRIIRFIRFSLDYESEIENKTIEAIKLNINGIKKISKDRILTELFKILDTRNFTKLNNNKDLREIFLLIFPELKNLDRLDRLNKISNQFNFDTTTLLAILLIDKTNNHEYFSHKYNISNNLKKNLQILAKNFINLNGDKNFFIKDLKKNFFYFGKEHLITLNQLNYSNNNQIKLKDYLNTFKTINTLILPKFPFDGNFLKNKGIKEGRKIGKMLKLIEEDWLDNGFKISDQRISKIINDEGN
jgi:poly(A) polymerase